LKIEKNEEEAESEDEEKLKNLSQFLLISVAFGAGL
jgi:hypothetical protein